MAKNLQYKKTITDKLSIKGILDNTDELSIVVDNDGMEETKTIIELLKEFIGEKINLSVTLKTEEDLTDSL